MNHADAEKLIMRPQAPYRGEPINTSRRRGPRPGALAVARRVRPAVGEIASSSRGDRAAAILRRIKP